MSSSIRRGVGWMRIDFRKGARFACPECGAAGCKVHDTESHTWRHLNFFEHEAYLTARVPRVICPEHRVRQVQVPWARERSDFTLLFEALVMALVKEMPVKAIAELVGEHDTKIWRIVHHYVDLAVEAQDLSGMGRAGIDETSSRRGQNYVSVFADLDERRALYVTEGRDQGVVQEFSCFLGTHGGDRKQITEVCQDMSEAYLAGTLKHLPAAEITFDRYHIKKHLNEAIDEVRRAESKQHKGLLKNTRYLWLKRPSKLTAKQQDWRANTNAKRRIDVEGGTALMRCCIGDGGAGPSDWWSSAVALQGEAANHRKLRRSRAVRGERLRKRRAVSLSGMGQEGERKRSTDDVSKAARSGRLQWPHRGRENSSQRRSGASSDRRSHTAETSKYTSGGQNARAR